jgi:hypothetical protein
MLFVVVELLRPLRRPQSVIDCAPQTRLALLALQAESEERDNFEGMMRIIVDGRG